MGLAQWQLSNSCTLCGDLEFGPSHALDHLRDVANTAQAYEQKGNFGQGSGDHCVDWGKPMLPTSEVFLTSATDLKLKQWSST
eukprot:5454624-Amphidinium_carterae.1